MPSLKFKMVAGQKMTTLAMERELDRRAVLAGEVPATPVVKLTPVQASIAARKERTLASLGPKVAAAIRHAKEEEERKALQLKRELREEQIEQRFAVAEEWIDARHTIDREAGWTAQSTKTGVHKIRVPGWMSVDGYQSMPDDWVDMEDMIEAEDETF
ncbi:MAG: hypothetical protein Q9166_004660 [cf. Caloplaca sp. 2 TL-2023]